MPVVFRNKSETSVSVCVWHITETEVFFWNQLQLSSSDAQQIRQLKLSSRRLEKLACRAALNELAPSSSSALAYTSYGQPNLPGIHLSFSHCRDFVAVALSPDNCVGVDIEHLSERMLKLYPKFLNPDEQNIVNVSDLNQLHFCWGAKEAVYKCFSGRIKDFVNDISIVPESDWQTATCKVNCDGQQHHIALQQLVFDNVMLVLASRRPF